MAGKSSNQEEVIADINIVPLVDIILVVLIIFMVTAPAMIKPSVELDLPSMGSADETQPSLLQVAITADGRVVMNDVEVGSEEVKSAAQTEFARNPETQAIIAADKNVPHGTVMQVLDWVKSAGIKNLAVTTDRPTEL